MDSDNRIHLTRITAKILAGTVHVLVMVFGTWIFTRGLARLVHTVTYKWDE